MLNFKDAVQGLKNVEKAADETVGAAKNILQGAQKASDLAGLARNVPEPELEALRKLIAEAQQLVKSAEDKNEALEACIQKARALLNGKDLSADTVARATAELTALMKGTSSGAAKASAPGSPQKPAPASAAPARADEPAKADVQFSDVKPGAYYYDAVQWAVQKGVASGTSETTFGPDQDCTRAQTIPFLWRAAGSPAPKTGKNPFTDVAESAYYYPAVLWASERGIVSGTAFNPDAAVTRAQLATFLYREAGSPAVGANPDFADVPSDAYFCQAVAWAAAKGITSGVGEHTFSPDTVCTRGQIVTFLHRAQK